MVSHKVLFSFPRGEEVSSEELMHARSVEIDCWMNLGLMDWIGSRRFDLWWVGLVVEPPPTPG